MSSSIYVNFEGSTSLVSCDEGKPISDILSFVLCKLELEQFKEAKSIITEKESRLEQEKSRVEATLKPSKKKKKEDDYIYQIVCQITEISKQITEISKQITMLQSSILNKTFGVMISSGDWMVYHGDKKLELTTTVDATLIQLTEKEPLFICKPSKPPDAKRMKFADLSCAKPPSCESSPSDVILKKGSASHLYTVVPVYYHWFAIVLHDKFFCKTDDQCILRTYNHDSDKLDIAVQSLIAVQKNQPKENEYMCSSLVQNALDRFLFNNNSAACLSQYPVKDTRRTDFSIYTLKDSFPHRAVLHSDYKPFDLDAAYVETLVYYINENEDKKTFSWSFGLPCTSSQMTLCLYLSANTRVLCIKLITVHVGNTSEFKNFLAILYAAVHWRIDNMESPAKQPLSCHPCTGLVLRDNFVEHVSDRVFYNERNGKAYKFFQVGDTKCHNYELMNSLGYFEDLKIEMLGKQHFLLSYKAIKGTLKPKCKKQIEAARQVIRMIHRKGMVHSDIRIGNIVFVEPNEAFLIDFDFAAQAGTCYHENFNGELSERHPTAKPLQIRRFEHDTYALDYISNLFL